MNVGSNPHHEGRRLSAKTKLAHRAVPLTGALMRTQMVQHRTGWFFARFTSEGALASW